MSEHTSTPSDFRKSAAPRRKPAKKTRPKKAGPGTNGQRDAYGRFQAGNPAASATRTPARSPCSAAS
jgi:hypothetical protein